MKPSLRRLHSPDVEDLAVFCPGDTFSVLVQLIVGPEGAPGEESFDVTVCSPAWLDKQGGPVVGRHHLIVSRYSYDAIVDFVEEYLRGCDGSDWRTVATKVGRLGRWEFEDYDS